MDDQSSDNVLYLITESRMLDELKSIDAVIKKARNTASTFDFGATTNGRYDLLNKEAAKVLVPKAVQDEQLEEFFLKHILAVYDNGKQLPDFDEEHFKTRLGIVSKKVKDFDGDKVAEEASSVASSEGKSEVSGESVDGGEEGSEGSGGSDGTHKTAKQMEGQAVEKINELEAEKKELADRYAVDMAEKDNAIAEKEQRIESLETETEQQKQHIAELEAEIVTLRDAGGSDKDALTKQLMAANSRIADLEEAKARELEEEREKYSSLKTRVTRERQNNEKSYLELLDDKREIEGKLRDAKTDIRSLQGALARANANIRAGSGEVVEDPVGGGRSVVWRARAAGKIIPKYVIPVVNPVSAVSESHDTMLRDISAAHGTRKYKYHIRGRIDNGDAYLVCKFPNSGEDLEAFSLPNTIIATAIMFPELAVELSDTVAMTKRFSDSLTTAQNDLRESYIAMELFRRQEEAIIAHARSMVPGSNYTLLSAQLLGARLVQLFVALGLDRKGDYRDLGKFLVFLGIGVRLVKGEKGVGELIGDGRVVPGGINLYEDKGTWVLQTSVALPRDMRGYDELASLVHAIRVYVDERVDQEVAGVIQYAMRRNFRLTMGNTPNELARYFPE